LIIETIIEALKFILPAYCANAIPVIIGGGKPLDLGKNYKDGRRIFGENKTFRGFFSGLIIGSLVGIAENLFFGYPILFGFITSLGALTGDLVKSFFKRRIGLKPGKMLPVADQLDFVLGATLFSFLLMPPTLEVFITIIIITPPVHLITNFLAYLLKLKSHPF